MMAVLVATGRLADIAEKARLRPQIRADLARGTISGAGHGHLASEAERLCGNELRQPVDRDMLWFSTGSVNQVRSEKGQ